MAMHDGHRQRLRRRYLQCRASLDSFDDLAILEFLLFYAIPRQDTNPIAHRLLDRFGTLSAVMSAPIEDLEKVEGIGESAAVLLSLFSPVARRLMIEQCTDKSILNSTSDCGEYLLPHFFGEREEVVWLLCLDAKLMVLNCQLLYRGSIHSAGLSARKIAEAAMNCNACSVVLAHNHPGGVATPSQEDELTTQHLRIALGSVGILLLDHIIVAGNDFVSMLDSKML